MKTLTLAITLAVVAAFTSFAQIPGGIKYQGVARNGLGELFSNRTIHFRISVLDGSAQGAPVYVEKHLEQTNEHGLFNIVIGEGVPQSGTFGNIAWEASGKWVKIEMDPNGGNNFFPAGVSQMLSVPYAKVAERAVSDPSAENEIITDFSFNSGTHELSVTEAGNVQKVTVNIKADDLSDNTLNDLSNVDASPVTGNVLKWNGQKWIAGIVDPYIQTLAMDGHELSIAHGNSIDLSPYLDNTDSQQLTYSSITNTLTLDNGGSVDLTPLVEMGKNVSIKFDSATNMLTLTDGAGSVSVSLDGVVSDAPILSLMGSDLFMTGGDTLDLSAFLDNTDEQTLTLSGDTLSISNGNSVNLSSIISTTAPSLVLSGNDLSIANGDTVDLSPFLDNTDEQELSLTGNILSISNGNTVDLSSFLDDTDTDQQTLSLTGNALFISNGNSVDLTSYFNTDTQSLSLSGSDLMIANANTVDLSSFLDNTDEQTLSLTGNTLAISNGNSIDFSAFLNTDEQTLSFTGTSLSIAAGNTVNLSSLLDDTDEQSLTLTGTSLSIDNGNSVDLSSFLDDTDEQTLTLTGTSLSIENGNTVNLTGFLDNTDEQNLSISSDTLYIQNGNGVYLGDFNQTLDVSGNTLSISNGNSIALDNITLSGQTRLEGSITYRTQVVNGINDPYMAGEEAVILADGSLGAMTVRLPQASTVPGRVYTIKKTDSSLNAITINPHSVETIDGLLTPVLTSQYDFIQVISTGTQWYTIGK